MRLFLLIHSITWYIGGSDCVVGQPDLGEQYLPLEYIAAPDQPPTNANLEAMIMHISEYFLVK